jgi:hypothetical protein
MDWSTELPQRVARRLGQSSAPQFDPMLALSLVQLLFSVIRFCSRKSAETQLAQAKRRPRGIIARRLKRTLAERYAAAHPGIPDATIEEYVEIVVSSLGDDPDIPSLIEAANKES